MNYIFNVYEFEDEIILYGCCMSLIYWYFGIVRDFNENIFCMYGWVFNFKIGVVREGMLDKRFFEFFCINYRFVGW